MAYQTFLGESNFHGVEILSLWETNSFCVKVKAPR